MPERFFAGTRFLLGYLPVVFPILIAVWGFWAVLLLSFDSLYTTQYFILAISSSIVTVLMLFRVLKPDFLYAINLKRSNYASVVDLIFIGLLIVWTLNAFSLSSQHVFIDRDPGIHANVAVWLTNNSDLDFNNSQPDELKGFVMSNSAGFEYHTRDGGGLFAQGVHLLPALAGIVGRVVGLDAMFGLVSLFGASALCAVYALSRKIIRNSFLSIIPPVALGASFPFQYFSRDFYTEPIAMTLLIMAILLSILAAQQNKASLWAFAGFCVALGAAVRIDAYLSIMGFFVFAFLAVGIRIKERETSLLRPLWSLPPAVGAIALGWRDITVHSPQYYQKLRPRYLALLAGTALVLVLGLTALVVLHRFRGRFVSFFNNLPWRRIAFFAAIASFFVFLFYVSTPAWRENRANGRSDSHQRFVESLQATEGALQDGLRTHAENSSLWIYLYLGIPLFFFGFMGLSLFIFRSIDSKKDFFRMAPVVIMFLSSSLVYFYRPSIFPDQPWAIRRFLPAVYPILSIMAVVCVRWLSIFLLTKLRRWKWGAQYFSMSKGLVLSIFVPILLYTPVMSGAFFWGERVFAQQESVDRLCDVVGVIAERSGKEPVLVWLGPRSVINRASTNISCRVASLGLLEREATASEIVSKFSEVNSDRFALVFAYLSPDENFIEGLDVDALKNATSYPVSISYDVTERTLGGVVDEVLRNQQQIILLYDE